MRNKTILYLVIANLMFISYYLIIFLSTDVAFFYRCDGDSFNYYVMAKSLAETGSTDVSLAEGVPPITFTRIPAYVRFPIFMIFKELDNRIRALQIFDLFLLTLVANLFWIYLYITIPSNWNRIFTFIPFFYLAFDSWFLNVKLPMSETILALQFYTAILIVKKINYNDISFKRILIVVIALSALIWSAIMLKFTAASLIVFIIIYFYQSKLYSKEGKVHHNLIKIITTIIVVTIIALFLNLNLIKHYINLIYFTYMQDLPVHIITIRSITNLIFSAVPTQIIPTYYSFLLNPQNLPMYPYILQISLANCVWLISGFGISTIVVIGLWRLRWHMTAEIGCLIMLLIYMMGPGGTARHLTLVQPFLWIFFFQGCAEVMDALQIRLRLLVPGLIGLFFLIVIVLQMHLVKTISEWSIKKIKPGMSYSYIKTKTTNRKNIAAILRNTRNYIESLDKDRTLFVLMPDNSLWWFALLDIKYITQEKIYAKLGEGFDVYVVTECIQWRFDKTFINTQLFLTKIVNKDNINNVPVSVQENDVAKLIIYKLYL